MIRRKRSGQELQGSFCVTERCLRFRASHIALHYMRQLERCQNEPFHKHLLKTIMKHKMKVSISTFPCFVAHRAALSQLGQLSYHSIHHFPLLNVVIFLPALYHFLLCWWLLFLNQSQREGWRGMMNDTPFPIMLGWFYQQAMLSWETNGIGNRAQVSLCSSSEEMPCHAVIKKCLSSHISERRQVAKLCFPWDPLYSSLMQRE